MKNIALILFVTVFSACKLGEVDVNVPSYSCTADGYVVDDNGTMVVTEQGAAINCATT